MLRQLNLEGQIVEPWKDICCLSCWTAKEDKCVCRCQGRFHGQAYKETTEDSAGEGEWASKQWNEERKKLDEHPELFNQPNPDEEPPTLVWWECTVPKKCPWCKGELSELHYYDHNSGWEVYGFERKQWLYRNCKRCHYDFAIWKLGVPRE